MEKTAGGAKDRAPCRSRSPSAAALPGCRVREPVRSVVVYASIDQVQAEPVLRAFEASSGIRVLPVYDVEAAKTTALPTADRGETASASRRSGAARSSRLCASRPKVSSPAYYSPSARISPIASVTRRGLDGIRRPGLGHHRQHEDPPARPPSGVARGLPGRSMAAETTGIALRFRDDGDPRGRDLRLRGPDRARTFSGAQAAGRPDPGRQLVVRDLVASGSSPSA